MTARGVLDELVEEQRRFQPGLERRVGEEERAEQGQGDAHRADQQVLPGRLQRAGIVVEVEQRRTDQRRRLHRHPHQPQMVRQHHQRHHRRAPRTGWHRRPGWAGRGEGRGSPARRARQRKNRTLRKPRTTLPSGSSSSQPPSPATGGPSPGPEDRRDRPGQVARGPQRAGATAASGSTARRTSAAAITSGNKISR